MLILPTTISKHPFLLPYAFMPFTSFNFLVNPAILRGGRMIVAGLSHFEAKADGVSGVPTNAGNLTRSSFCMDGELS